MSQLSDEFKKNAQYSDQRVEDIARTLTPRVRDGIDKTIVNAGREAANTMEQLERTRDERIALRADMIQARRDQPMPTLHPAGLPSRRNLRAEDREREAEQASLQASREIAAEDQGRLRDQEAQFRARLREEVEKALKQETRSERAVREMKEWQARGRDRGDIERDR